MSNERLEIRKEERLAKGVNLLGSVKALRKWCQANNTQKIPKLSDEDTAFVFEQRVLATSMYPYALFERLLAVCRDLIYGANLTGTIKMGYAGAEEVYTGVYKAYIKSGQPKQTLAGFSRVWRAHFNFSEAELSFDESSAPQHL